MSKKTLIATAVGSAFVASMVAAPLVSAAENPFALSGLSSGYQVADNHSAKPMEGKPMEGKCGQGKCGAMKAGASESKPGPAMMDTNKDGKISKKEFIKGHEAMFAMLDANKDGFLDQTEMGKMNEGKCGGMK
ncbi:MAG: hypothetical protein Q8J70_11420 [Thiobacillus sp.]|nr:hypothetical protein [Thiobacillus sp.]